MSSGHSRENPADRKAGWFSDTHWSVVLAAGYGGSQSRQAALEQLCRAYWYPIYAYVRRHGQTHEDAQDLTQELFSRLMSRNYFQDLTPEKGKFRSFLLTSINHLMADERDRLNRAKRGGGGYLVSIDAQSADDRYRREPATNVTPEKIFERRWALALIQRVLDRLQDEQRQAGKDQLFDALKGSLTGDRDDLHYSSAARLLDMHEGTLRVAVFRLRQRFAELFREEVAHTVQDQADIESEIRHVLASLAE